MFVLIKVPLGGAWGVGGPISSHPLHFLYQREPTPTLLSCRLRWSELIGDWEPSASGRHRECLKHQGVQCDDGPSPQKKLRLKKVIAPSSSCVAAAAPTAEISKVVPRGMLTKDVYRPERKSPPKVTSNLRGMMSLGKQVSSPVRSPNKKSVWLV